MTPLRNDLHRVCPDSEALMRLRDESRRPSLCVVRHKQTRVFMLCTRLGPSHITAHMTLSKYPSFSPDEYARAMAMFVYNPRTDEEFRKALAEPLLKERAEKDEIGHKYRENLRRANHERWRKKGTHANDDAVGRAVKSMGKD